MLHFVSEKKWTAQPGETPQQFGFVSSIAEEHKGELKRRGVQKKREILSRRMRKMTRGRKGWWANVTKIGRKVKDD